ncbi:hypothetical protein ONZ51_g328 [Trametes cubensis]|uniref:FHA domain-containing protein n=1 Tax=Trametes cubensis TaxID=1111947 RepID=A0AAD7U487_9APHY|nr:hypothetical protein ONZ51_g328 [Trametes cubensis]
MPRDYPRSDYRDRDEERSPRYRRDRYSRENDRDDYRKREGSHRDEDDAKPRRRDDDRDRYRDKDQREDRDRGYGRRRDDDRERERDRDSRRAGPSRRSASPRARSSRPDSRSRSRSAAVEDKAKPNFAPSGLLAAETKTVKRADGTSTVLKYHEPPEARKPSGPDGGGHRRGTSLMFETARRDTMCDRQVQEKNEFGDVKTAVKPFIIDLESTNGTIVNDETIPTSRYYELMLGDVIKFGESTREYVLMNEEAA